MCQLWHRNSRTELPLQQNSSQNFKLITRPRYLIFMRSCKAYYLLLRFALVAKKESPANQIWFEQHFFFYIEITLAFRTRSKNYKLYLFIFNMKFIFLIHFFKGHSGNFYWAGHCFEVYKWSAGKSNVDDHVEASPNRFQSSELSTTAKT